MKILINGEKKYDIASAVIRYNSASDTSSLIISATYTDDESMKQFFDDLKGIQTLTILRDSGESNVSEFNYLSKFDRNLSDQKDTLNIILCKTDELSKIVMK